MLGAGPLSAAARISRAGHRWAKPTCRVTSTGRFVHSDRNAVTEPGPAPFLGGPEGGHNRGRNKHKPCLLIEPLMTPLLRRTRRARNAGGDRKAGVA
jgi:hypothetical protein